MAFDLRGSGNEWIHLFLRFLSVAKRVLSGALHALAQPGTIAALTVLLVCYAPGSNSDFADPLHRVCGGLLASTVMASTCSYA